MGVEPVSLLAILGMALATYSIRAGGLWLVGRLRLGPRATVWMESLPGALLAAIVTPAIVTGGLAGGVAALATMLVVIRTGSPLVAMVAGVAVTVAARVLLS